MDLTYGVGLMQHMEQPQVLILLRSMDIQIIPLKLKHLQQNLLVLQQQLMLQVQLEQLLMFLQKAQVITL